MQQKLKVKKVKSKQLSSIESCMIELTNKTYETKNEMKVTSIEKVKVKVKTSSMISLSRDITGHQAQAALRHRRSSA